MLENVLHFPVTKIKGIGEEGAANLNELGIHTIADLLTYFPFRYEDYSVKELSEIEHEEKATICGKIQSEPALQYYGKKKTRLSVRVLVDRYLITVIFFNQPYLKKKLLPGQTFCFTGKWDRNKMTLTASEWHEEGDQQLERIEPVYSVNYKIKVKRLRKWIFEAFRQYGAQIEEILPEGFLQKYKLLKRNEAMYFLHFPKTYAHAKYARRRMVYEEFLLFQLKMQAYRKVERELDAGESFTFSKTDIQTFTDALPFQLTSAQMNVTEEILSDLKSPFRMNRLLQGDVGSGKTVVAMIALYAAFLSGFQGALMVPTEILAEQHFESISALLSPFGVNIALLTSRVKGKKRKEQLEKLQQGEIHLLIGTHALIQADVNFKQLGLVITDEQHRFGVNQRKILRSKGERPNVLFMTATPIPRTLAITAFGDMDVSTISEMPKGRKPVKTVTVKHDSFPQVLDFVENELKKGHQAYVICPLIEESEKLDVQNAIDVYNILAEHYKQFKVGLMHGRLSSEEKESVMEAYSKNEVQVLVSTTVVEVGVNVPNATTMVIYDAERFGLAQLHQLRGRVGRSDKQSYCILIADPKSEIGKERMFIMTQTNNGFELSQRDLELRGPGDFFGAKQSGLPEFKIADMVHDYRTLEVAREDAVSLIKDPAFWDENSYNPLRDYLQSSGVLSGEKLD